MRVWIKSEGRYATLLSRGAYFSLMIIESGGAQELALIENDDYEWPDDD